MELIFILLLSTLFAYAYSMENMRLSLTSKNVIKDILKTSSTITEPEKFIEDYIGIGRLFSHVNEEGSTKLVEAVSQAYQNYEMDFYDFECIIREGARVGKINYRDYFSRVKGNCHKDILRVAAINGHLDILERGYRILKERYVYDVEILISALDFAIKAGQLHIVRWFDEKGLIRYETSYLYLMDALRSNNQEVIDYLFFRPISVDKGKSGNGSTSKKELRTGNFKFNFLVFLVAVQVGNLNVFQYFLDDIPYYSLTNLEEAYYFAVKNGSNTMADPIGDSIMQHLQWNVQNNYLNQFKVKYSLFEALKANHQKVINYLLHEALYQNPLKSGTRLNYEGVMRTGKFDDHDNILKYASEVGNIEVVQYYLNRGFFTDYYNLEKLKKIAVKNGHNEIVDLIELTIINTLKWNGKNGSMIGDNLLYTLIDALEINNQKVVDLLIYENIYKNPLNGGNLLTLDECIRLCIFSLPKELFIKAVEVGNMSMIQFCLDHEYSNSRSYLESAHDAATAHGHTEIAELIEDLIFKLLQSSVKKGSLGDFDATYAFSLAIKFNDPEIIDLLLHQPLYKNPINDGDLLNYEDAFRLGQFHGHEKLFFEAAGAGNIDVVQYYLGKEFFKSLSNLAEAQKAASSKGHTEIADLLETLIMLLRSDKGL